MISGPTFLQAGKVNVLKEPEENRTKQTIVAFEDVVKRFDGRPVLDGVSFSIEEGEHVTLVGESTSGKTTVFKIMVGLVRPDSGRVTIFGNDMDKLSERELAGLLRKVEMQFQSSALFDSMSVSQNIMFVLDEQTRLSKKEKAGIVDHLLEGVSLRSARDRFPYELSGGMKKRVAVARALATSPRLALFDEPAAGLDPVTSARIVLLIKTLVAEHRMTMMAATNDVHTAMQFSDRCLILRKGRIYMDSTWSELKDSEDEYVRKFLGRAIKKSEG